MKLPQNDTIRRTAIEVLEQFAMMIADVDDPSVPAPAAPLYRACIKIEHSHAIQICLYASHTFCTALARNAIGVEEPVSEELARDALKELANILAGRLALTCFGDIKATPLSIPVADIIRAADWQKAGRRASASALNVEGSPLLVCCEPA